MVRRSNFSGWDAAIACHKSIFLGQKKIYTPLLYDRLCWNSEQEDSWPFQPFPQFLLPTPKEGRHGTPLKILNLGLTSLSPMMITICWLCNYSYISGFKPNRSTWHMGNVIKAHTRRVQLFEMIVNGSWQLLVQHDNIHIVPRPVWCQKSKPEFFFPPLPSLKKPYFGRYWLIKPTEGQICQAPPAE